MRELIAETCDELRAQLSMCADARKKLKPGEYWKELANSTANLARALQSLSAETRQHEKHAKAMAAKLSNEERDLLVREYLQDCDKERRLEFLRILQDLQEEDLLLG